MFKHFRALGIAGLTTLSASQLALAGPDSVLWSQNKEHTEVIVSGIKVAARTISRLNQHLPLVRFTSNELGRHRPGSFVAVCGGWPMLARF